METTDIWQWYEVEVGFSSGREVDTYVQIPTDPKDAEEYFITIRDDYDNQYYWSEHYRGVNFNKIDVPPPQWLFKQRDLYVRQEKAAKNNIKAIDILLQPVYNKILENLEEPENERVNDQM